MSKKSSPEKSPAQPAKPEVKELSEKQLDQAAGGLVYDNKPYYPKRP